MNKTLTAVSSLFAVALAFSSVACSAPVEETKPAPAPSASAPAEETPADQGDVAADEEATAEEAAPAPAKPAPAKEEAQPAPTPAPAEPTCAAEEIRSDVAIGTFGAGAYVKVSLQKSKEGTTASWIDGDTHGTTIAIKEDLWCRHVGWRSLKFTCTAGKWVRDANAQIVGDHECFAVSDHDAVQTNLEAGIY